MSPHRLRGFHLEWGPPRTPHELQEAGFDSPVVLSLLNQHRPSRHGDITVDLPMEALSILESFNSKVLTLAGDYRSCETFCKITAGTSPRVIWKICRIIFHVCGGVQGAPRLLAPSRRSLTHILFRTELGNTQRACSGAEPSPVTSDNFHVLRGFLTEHLPHRPHHHEGCGHPPAPRRSRALPTTLSFTLRAPPG